MNLKNLRDHELLSATKDLAHHERSIVTKILHHLREIERRKLYSDLGCSSLFDYAVKHLHYSEGQAGRRIQAMRLLKEIPELEEKINSGALSLSNISQAQSFFRESAHGINAGGATPKIVTREQKIKVLALLENKSARDGQRELIELAGDVAMPKERERVLAADKSEVRFVMDQGLKNKLEEVRSLLGPEGSHLGIADLINRLAEISTQTLRQKRFGKQRAEQEKFQTSRELVCSDDARQNVRPETPTPTLEPKPSPTNPRYITREIKHLVWQRDRGSCTSCGSRRGLNYDHIVPIARGGRSSAANLRLLCFACNQRAGIRDGLVPLKNY